MENKVSIIVPIYNAENYLENLIKSIIGQDYKNIEVILINDGSKDRSLMICEKYKKEDIRIKIIDKKNEGVSKARNIGIKESTGEYICFVDSDDNIEKTYVSTLIKGFSDDTDLVICNYNTINLVENTEIKSNIPIGVYNTLEIADRFWEFLEKGVINMPWNKMFKSSLIKENNLEFPAGILIGEDGYFVDQYLIFTNKVRIIENHLYNYYIYENQTSQKMFDTFFDMMIINYDMIENFLRKKSTNKTILYDEKYTNEYFKMMNFSIKFITLSKKYNKRKKREEIIKIIENDRTKKILKNKVYSKQYKILKFLLKTRQINLILFVYKKYFDGR